MHRNWNYGNSFEAVLSSVRHFHFLRLAALVTTFVAIDGPLLQRASSVTTAVQQSNISLTLPIRTGPLVNRTTPGVNFPTAYFSELVLAYDHRNGMVLPSSSCEGVCKTTVIAAGFDADCNLNRTTRAHAPPLKTQHMTRHDGCNSQLYSTKPLVTGSLA